MSEFSYVRIYPDKYEDVIKHLRVSFFLDEPLNKSVSLCKPGQPHPELEEFSLSILSQGVSFMGVHNSTGQVVGVILNGYQDTDKTGKKIYKDQKLQKIFDFLETADKDVEYLKQFNVRDILEVKILSVDSNFRGKGMARVLYELTEEYAKANNYLLMRTDATAIYSQRLFQKMGFEVIKEVFYDEYPSKEAPTFNVEPPHVSFKLLVKKIKD